MKAAAAAFVAGVVFAVGLALGGMMDPAKVAGFLDVAGRWDFSLALVMGGALGTHAVLRRLILRRGAPVLAASFSNLPAAKIDARLLGGAGLFGIGWGLSGYCPGPALSSAGVGGGTVLVFCGAMLLGMGGFTALERLMAKRRESAPPQLAG